MAEAFRYVGAGGVNTLFGVAAFVLLVRIGVDQYPAQIISHVLGSAFNYYTYRVHVFRTSSGSFRRFFASYVTSYFLSLGILVLVNYFISPSYPLRMIQIIIHAGGGNARQAASYCSGLITVVLVAIVNYFVLKRFVFRRDDGPLTARGDKRDDQ